MLKAVSSFNPVPVINGGSGSSVGSFLQIPPAIAQRGSTTPTITYSGSAMSSPQYIPAFIGATSIYGAPTGGPNTLAFGYYATTSGTSARHPTAAPQFNVLQATYDTPEVYGCNPFWVCFNHTGTQFDLIKYGTGCNLIIFVDDVFVSNIVPYIATGTAQAGAASTITLASSDTMTNNGYLNCSVVIVSGTGSGQVRKISAYNSSTKVTTVSASWSVNPTSSSVYAIVHDANGLYTQPADGSINYYNFNFGSVGTRKISMYCGDFIGVNIGQTDAIAPSVPISGNLRAVVVGDSFIEGSGGPFNAQSTMDLQICQKLGVTPYGEGEGGTGWCNPNASSGKLNFMDRIAPPIESWSYLLIGASAGNYTISVTYGGSTQTTGNIAYNASASTIQTAVQGLSNAVSNSVSVGGGGDTARPFFLLLHNMSGATVAINTGGLTFTSLQFARWKGTIDGRVPKNSLGQPLPFLLYVQGSGNDSGGSYTSSQVQTNATYTAQQIVQRFPTAITVFTGIVSANTHGGSGLIDSTDVGYNTAIYNAAKNLNLLNGQVPFIDTYAAGAGGYAWLNGGSNVSSPTNGKTDNFISVVASGHPTGDGHSFLSGYMAQNIKKLFGSA